MTGLDGVQPQGPQSPTIFRATTRRAGGLPGDFEPVDLSIHQSAAIEAGREEERQAFADVMYRVTKHSPSMQAEVRKLGVDLQHGVSREAIRKNLPAFQRAWQVRQVESLDLKNTAPLLYKDLANIEFASVAYDVVKDLSTFERISGDLKRDWMLNVRNKIGAVATGLEGRELTDKEWAEIASIEDEMMELPSLDNYFSPALGFIGQQAETVTSSAGYVATGAVAGSAVPAFGTVAGAGWGLRVGYAANSYNVNSGGSYISMRRAGVSHQTARDHARMVGAGSTVLEMAGARMLTGVSPKKLKDAVKRLAQGGNLEKIGLKQFAKEALKRSVIGGLGETATETAQTAVELVAAESARRADTEAGLVHPETGQPITSTIKDGDPWGELLDTAITTAQAMSVLGPAAGSLRAGARFRYAKKQVDKTQEFYRSLGSDGIKTLAERAPDVAAEHICKRVKDSPFDHLQVDVRDLRRVLGDLGMDDKQITEMLPDAERAFELAAEHPDMAVDVTVETGDFISEVVTRPEVYKALAKVVRAEGDFMSLEQIDAERQELAKMEGELVQAAEKADEQLDAEDAALSEAEGEPASAKPVNDVDSTAAQVQVVSKKLREMIGQAGVAGSELNEAVNVQRAMLFRQYSLEQVMERNADGAVQPVAFDDWFENFGFRVLAQNGYEAVQQQKQPSGPTAQQLAVRESVPAWGESLPEFTELQKGMTPQKFANLVGRRMGAKDWDALSAASPEIREGQRFPKKKTKKQANRNREIAKRNLLRIAKVYAEGAGLWERPENKGTDNLRKSRRAPTIGTWLRQAGGLSLEQWGAVGVDLDSRADELKRQNLVRKDSSGRWEDVAHELKKAGYLDGYLDATSEAVGGGDHETAFLLAVNDALDGVAVTSSLDGLTTEAMQAMADAERRGEVAEEDVDGWQPREGDALFSDEEGAPGPQGFYRRTVSDSGQVQRVITLILQAQNVSTLLHESAHLFFDARIDLLRRSLANPDKFVSPTVGQDIDTLFDAMEVGDPSDSLQSRLDLWDSLTPDEIRPKHEAVARNFERYMMAGESPATPLDRTFSRISHWMTSWYGDAEAVNTAYKAAETLRSGKPYTKDLFEMTPEVRQVFDRLFAAREDVRAAMRGVGEGLGAGFGEREDSDIEEAAAAEVGRQMVSDAVRQGLINPKRIESRVGADARRIRKGVAAQELERSRKEPVHRLRKFLATGEFTNEAGEVTGDRQTVHRLNTADVRAMVPGSVREYGNVTSPDGLAPREVASLFGYESATEMMVDLRDQPRIKEAVRERTQKRMAAEFSELATPIAIQNTIKAAIAGEASQAFIADQIDNVLGRQGNSDVTLQAARGAARRRIRKMTLRELRTDRFEQSARRNRRLARERWADGDVEGAADAYRAELVDTATVREIARSRVTVENGERRLLDHFAASKDRARAKERDTRYLAVGRELLARVGLGPRPSKPGEATETLRRRDPEFYESIGSYIAPIESFQTPDFRNLTWEQFEQVMDIGDLLWNRSRTQKFGELNQKRFDRNARTDDLLEQLGKIGALKDYEAGPVKGFFGEAASLLTRAEHAMIRLDGGDRGVWWNTMYLPVRKAFDRATARQRKHLQHLRELLNNVDVLSNDAPSEVGAFASRGEFNHVFGKDAHAGQSVAHELVALLVNLGTQSNRDRLMLGNQWSARIGKDKHGPANLQPMQNFLRRMVSEGILRDEHFALAQGILDTYEEILPSFQKATLATQGIYANELEATPLVVQSGDKVMRMRGGYAPARYDETSKTKAKQEGKQAAQDQGLFFGNSATKDRVEGFSDVVSLRLSDTMLAFQDHIRFAEVAPVAKQIRDLLEGGETRDGESLGQVLRKTNPGIWSDHTSALYVLLSRATTGKLASHVREPSRLSRFLRSIRNSFGLLQFSFDVKNATENFSGLAQASAIIGPRWVAYGFRHQDGEFASKGNDFMANRLAEDTQQVIATDIDPGDSTTAIEKKIAYVLPRWTQNIVDRTIWAGAYQRFMSVDRTVDMPDDKAHKEAVEYANSTVRQINSADMIDVGSYEGMFGEFGRLLTQWFSWANGQQQLTKTLWHKTMQEGGVGRYGRFAYRFMMQHWASYMVAGAVSVLSRDIPDEEEEIERALVEGLLVEPLKFTVHAAAPIAGDVVTFGVSKAIGERAFQAGSMPSISKAQTVVDDLVGVDSSTPKALADLAFLFRNFLPPKLRAAAALTGSASRQIDYGSKVAAGDVEPTGAPDAVRGALTGKTSPESRRQ